MAKIIKKEHSGVDRAPTSGGSRVIKAEHTGARSAVIKVESQGAESAGSKIIKAQSAAPASTGDTDVARAAVDGAAAELVLEDTEALELPGGASADLEGVGDVTDPDVDDEDAAPGDDDAPEELRADDEEDLGSDDAAEADGDPGPEAFDEVAAALDAAEDAGAPGAEPTAGDEDSPYARAPSDDSAILAAVQLDDALPAPQPPASDPADPFAEPASTEEHPLPREGSAVHREVLPRENSSLHQVPLPREHSALRQNPFAEPEGTPELPREQSAVRRRITPRNDEQVEGMARSFIARAQNEARALHEAVEQEIAQAVADAEQRGHAEGLARTAQLVEKVEHLAEGLLKEVEPQAVEAAIAVARQLIDAELTARPHAMVAVVRQALMSARQQRDVYVRVNPVHAETLRQHKREVVDVLGRAKDIDVREDPDLAPGGCMVETEIGTIDARLETQFEALVRHLTGGPR